MKVLITGGAGFLGWATARAAVDACPSVLRWRAEHDMVDRDLAGKLAPPAR